MSLCCVALHGKGKLPVKGCSLHRQMNRSNLSPPFFHTHSLSRIFLSLKCLSPICSFSFLWRVKGQPYPWGHLLASVEETGRSIMEPSPILEGCLIFIDGAFLKGNWQIEKCFTLVNVEMMESVFFWHWCQKFYPKLKLGYKLAIR